MVAGWEVGVQASVEACTFIVTESLADPFGPVQFNVYVCEVLSAPVEAAPETAFAPVQPPEAVQEVTFDEVQVRLAEVFAGIEIGPSELFAFRSTAGVGAETTT